MRLKPREAPGLSRRSQTEAEVRALQRRFGTWLRFFLPRRSPPAFKNHPLGRVHYLNCLRHRDRTQPSRSACPAGPVRVLSVFRG